MTGRKRGAASAVLTILAMLATGCNIFPPRPTPPRPAGIVQACGTEFCVDGHTFRFTGWNTPEAVASGGCAPTRPDPSQLASAAKGARVSVIRFFLFQDFTDSGRDFSRMDALVEAAKNAGVRLLPILENGNSMKRPLWDDPSSSTACAVHSRPRPNIAWFHAGYRSPYAGFSMSYEDYATTTVRRYKDQPAIFAWSLLNEPVADDGQCDPAFHDFFQHMTDAVASADPNHLVTGGSAGPGSNGFSCAGSPNTYENILSLQHNSFGEYHDYTAAAPLSPSPSPSFPTCGGRPPATPCLDSDTQFAVGRAKKFGKPIIAGEMGIPRQNAARAEEYRRRFEAAFGAGVAGVIPWRFEFAPGPRGDLFWFGPGDPVLQALADYGCGAC